jgi:hypothetical protein
MAVAFVGVVAAQMIGPGSVIMPRAAVGMTLMPLVMVVKVTRVIRGPVVGHLVPMLGFAAWVMIQIRAEGIRGYAPKEVATGSQQDA